VKAPEFTSVDHILEEVRAMRVRGGSAFGQAAARAFQFVAVDPAIQTADAMFAELDRVSSALLEEKPTMATIRNARLLIIEAAKNSVSANDLTNLRENLSARVDLFIQMSLTAVDTLGRIGAHLVGDGQTIMMHSFSESVLAIFEQARRAGKQFEVICTESRPLREGRFSAGRLSAMGVPVVFVTDASMAEVVRVADWVIVGADCIGIDGSVANKMGTNLLSILADRFDVPFYVASEILKLNPMTKQGQPIRLEFRPPTEVADKDEFESSVHVGIRNQFFDVTPPQRIRALVTERGLSSPGMAGQAWHEMQAAFERDLKQRGR